jgi:hypothetical protein
MGRYYFHVIDGDQTLPDPMGGEFANVHQAKEHAIEHAKDLIQARLQDRARWGRCAFVIANHAGEPLLRLPLTACSNLERDSA